MGPLFDVHHMPRTGWNVLDRSCVKAYRWSQRLFSYCNRVNDVSWKKKKNLKSNCKNNNNLCLDSYTTLVCGLKCGIDCLVFNKIHLVSLQDKGIIAGNFVRNYNKTVTIMRNGKTACEVMWRECNIQMKSMTSYPFYYLFAHCFCSEHQWRIYWQLHRIPAFEQWSRSPILFMI